MFPSSWGSFTHRSRLPSHQPAERPAEPAPPTHNANVAEPAATAAPGASPVQIDQLIQDVETEQRYRRQAHIVARWRQQQMMNRPNWRSRGLSRIAVCLAIFWTICIFISLLLLAIPGLLKPEVRYDCPVKPDGRQGVAIGCATKTWVICVWWTASCGGLVNVMRRHYLSHNQGLSRCAQMMWSFGSLLLLGVIVLALLFTALHGHQCLKGCVYPE